MTTYLDRDGVPVPAPFDLAVDGFAHFLESHVMTSREREIALLGFIDGLLGRPEPTPPINGYSDEEIASRKAQGIGGGAAHTERKELLL